MVALGGIYAANAATARSSAGESCAHIDASAAATITLSPAGAWTRHAISW